MTEEMGHPERIVAISQFKIENTSCEICGEKNVDFVYDTSLTNGNDQGYHDVCLKPYLRKAKHD